MLQSCVQDLFDAAKFGAPEISHGVEALVNSVDPLRASKSHKIIVSFTFGT